MKKVKIFIVLSFIFLGSIIFKLFYVSTSANSTVKYNIMIDSTKSATFPSTNNYTVSVNCTSGKGTVTWNPKLATPSWEFKFENGYVNDNGTYTRSNITSNDTCDILFTTRTVSNKLNAHIKSLAGTTSGTGNVTDYGTASGTAIAQAKLNNGATFSTLQNASDYGTSCYSNNCSSYGQLSSYYTFTNNKWVNKAASEGSIYSRITIPANGFYKLYWTNASSSISFTAYNSNSYVTVINAQKDKPTEQEYNYNYLNAGDYIDIYVYIPNNQITSGIITFYLKKATNYTTSTYYHDIGIRYTGSNPDNYIEFNNELWRIIGIFRDAKTTSLTINDSYYTKIIRNESIGSYVYNTVANSSVSSSAYSWWNKSDGSVANLNYILNHYYMGADNDNYDGTSDATNCWFANYSSTNLSRNCDFRVIGIQPGWRDMVKNTTWYIAAASHSYNASTSFIGERGTVSGPAGGELSYKDTTTNKYSKVGLMYPSDYLYSGSSSSTRWLLQNGYERTISPTSDKAVMIISDDGSVSQSFANEGYAVRPVVYLSDSVYVTGGDGSLLNPYTIAM